MKKLLFTVLSVCSLNFISLPSASAEIPVPEDIYMWVQSSPRANYYFNKAQMCFDVDSEGMIDQNTLIVPVVKTYDPLQIKDVQDKRLWRGQDNGGYDDFSGIAEILRIDLSKKIVTEAEVSDLDSTASELEKRYPNRSWEMNKLSDKNLEKVFYQAILDYAQKHHDELLARTKGTVKPEDMENGKKLSDKRMKKVRN